MLLTRAVPVTFFLVSSSQVFLERTFTSVTLPCSNITRTITSRLFRHFEHSRQNGLSRSFFALPVASSRP